MQMGFWISALLDVLLHRRLLRICRMEVAELREVRLVEGGTAAAAALSLVLGVGALLLLRRALARLRLLVVATELAGGELGLGDGEVARVH